MFSGPLEKTAISIIAGVVVGLADAVGFFYSARLFLVNATTQKRTIAGVLEAVRLILLIVLVVFLFQTKSFSIIWLLCSALLFSLGGKLFFIFKRLKV